MMSGIDPYKDKPSDSWALKPQKESLEVIPGIGNYVLRFILWNKTSHHYFNAYYKGTAIGVSLGLTVSLDSSWCHFGTAGKVTPFALSGIGAELISIGGSLGIAGYSVVSLKLPNVDTSPAKIPIGGFTGSLGGSIGVFYSGGEFRVGNQAFADHYA